MTAGAPLTFSFFKKGRKEEEKSLGMRLEVKPNFPNQVLKCPIFNKNIFHTQINSQVNKLDMYTEENLTFMICSRTKNNYIVLI